MFFRLSRLYEDPTTYNKPTSGLVEADSLDAAIRMFADEQQWDVDSVEHKDEESIVWFVTRIDGAAIQFACWEDNG